MTNTVDTYSQSNDDFHPYLFKVIDSQGNDVDFSIPLRRPRLDPSFKWHQKLSHEHKFYQNQRAELLDALLALIKLGYSRPRRGTLSREYAFQRLERLSNDTLRILLREYKGGTGPEELMEILEDSHSFRTDDKESTLRNLATYRLYLSDMNHEFAEEILSQIRMNAAPMFAYSDLSQLTGEELAQFKAVLSFYRMAYEELVPEHIKQTEEFDYITYTKRRQALGIIPSIDPKAARFLWEYTDHKRVINYINKYRPQTLNVDAVKKHVTARPGIFKMMRAK